MKEEHNLNSILDEYADRPKAEEVKRTATTPTPKAKAAQKPVEKPKRKLNASVKQGLIFGGLFALIAFWQYTGQMAATAAVPSMCVCAALGGYGVGKNRSDR